jgi:hypothetical protein
MKKRRPLPLGSQTFSYIIEKEAIYVDKTPYLYDLISGTVNKYFLSRPRRFGKSLTISTLKALFSGQKELFKDLYITKETDYDFPSFPVLHFDFSEIGHQTSAELSRILKQHIEVYAANHGHIIQNSETLAESWGQLMAFFKGKSQKIVILIDEYDKPILDHITNLPIAKENRDALKSFYEIIKANDESLRFVFITGITKFSQMNIFSGMNNLRDISLDAAYAAICGYTQTELETSFASHLIQFAEAKNMTTLALLDKIKTWYNGFRFTEVSVTLYNPFSTLLLLDSQQFQYHWFSTGTPTYLMQLFQQLNVDVQNIPNQISINDTASYDIDNFQVNLPVLLFQTGYLTIIDVAESGLITLDYPNLEVREAFTQKLLQTLVLSPTSPEVTIITLRDALYQNNLTEIFRIMTLFFAKIPYDIQEATEKYYQSLFYLIFTVIGTRIRVEVRTHNGRIDALIETATHVYVFEFKLLRRLALGASPQDGNISQPMSSALSVADVSVEGSPLESHVATTSPEEKTRSAAAQRALAEAMAQINSKDYTLSFQDSGKTIVKVAAVFSVQERNILAWTQV